MDGKQLTEWLTDAEVRLAHALARLHQAEADALVGIHYDASEFDQIVLDYRKAKRDAEEARQAWQEWQPAPAATPDVPLEPTPALLFAKWLYDHGRITS